MIKKYFNFKSLALLESLLFVDDDLRDIIKILAKGGDKISKSLIMLFDEDVKTNINYLRASDKNDELKFVNDAQVKRFQDAGQNPFDKTVNVTKIGRAIRQLFSANNLTITDQDIENFVNLYKNAWDKKFTKMDGFRLVSGEEIRFWYLEDNYVNGGGQLNSSCMRYERCQPYLDIYVKNPEVCQLLIYVDKSNRLLGRALVWKLTDKTRSCDYLLDRIYTRFDNDSDKISNWFEEHFKTTDYNSFPNNIRGCSVTIKNKDFDNYPYADTFWVLDWDDNKLLTFEARKYDRLQLQLQQTEGYANAPGYKRSKRLSKWIRHDEAIFCRYIEDYLPKSDCVQERSGQHILKDDAIYSDYYESYILKSNSMETEFGIVDKNDVVKVYDIIDGSPANEKIAIKSSDDFINNYNSITYLGKSIFVNNKFLVYSLDMRGYVLKTQPGNKLYLHKTTEKVITKGLYRYSCFGDNFQYNGYKYFIPYGIFLGRDKYYTEPSLKMLGLDIDDRKFIICSDEMYLIYSESIKDIIIKIVDSLGINDEVKSAKIDEIVKADQYLTVKQVYKYKHLQEFYKNIENTSVLDYVNNTIADMFKKYRVTEHFNNISEGYSSYIFSNKHSFSDGFYYFKESNNGKIEKIKPDFRSMTQAQIKEVIDDFVMSSKYEIYMFAYYLVIFGGKSFANNVIEVFLQRTEKNSSSFRRVIGIVFHDIISDQFNNSIHAIAKIMSTEGGTGSVDINILKETTGIHYSDLFKQSLVDNFDNFYQKLF